jgi:hypothetical protein
MQGQLQITLFFIMIVYALIQFLWWLFSTSWQDILKNLERVLEMDTYC